MRKNKKKICDNMTFFKIVELIREVMRNVCVFKYLFILWPLWVLIAACRFSLVVAKEATL